jgi:hypothetical protein
MSAFALPLVLVLAAPGELGEPARPALLAFRAAHGPWRCEPNPRNGAAGFLHGPPLAGSASPLPDAAAIERSARAFLERAGALLGVRPEDLVLDRVVRTRSLWVVGFTQTWGGVPVEGGSVGLRYTPDGALAAVVSSAFPPPGPSPAVLPADAALALARERLGSGPAARRVPALFYATGAERGGASLPIPRLAWSVELGGPGPVRRLAALDAATGALLSLVELVQTADVTGNVSARVLTGGPLSAPQSQPLPSLALAVVGGAGAVTDALGSFRIPHPGTQPVQVAGRLLGPWADVRNGAGADLAFNVAAVPGVPVTIALNPAPGTEHATAQATAFREVSRFHDWVRGLLPGFTGLDFPLRAIVNEPGSCNAYWDGAAIHTTAAGGTCPNAAFPDVLNHENGHAFHQAIHGSTLPQDFSEGLGDMFTMLLTGQPVVGRDFYGAGRPIRDYGVPVQPPVPWAAGGRRWNDPACNGEVHCLGEAWAGFAWDLRGFLVQRLGGAGARVAEQLLLDTCLANPGDQASAVREAFLQDDNDGDLSNGTPDFLELARAADAHGFPRPPDPTVRVSLSHAPVTGTDDTVNPVAIEAEVFSLYAPIAAVALVYDRGAGNVVVPLGPAGTPGRWRASIPPSPCGSSVRYFLAALDVLGNAAALPAGAPAARFAFRVEHVATVFREDFEGAVPAWTAGASRGVSDWEAGPPNPQGRNPYDPRAAGSGARSLGNDLGNGTDGNYEVNTTNFVDLPLLDLRGRAGVRLAFRRWLTVQPREFDQARVRVNGAVVWENPTGSAVLDQAWTAQELDVSALADGRSAVAIRFELNTDAVVAMGGWNLDDVRVTARDCNVAALAALDPMPRVGTVLQLDFRAGAGAGWLLLGSPSAGPTAVPGLGTFRLGFPVALPGLVGRTLHLQLLAMNVPANPHEPYLFSNPLAIVFR